MSAWYAESAPLLTAAKMPKSEGTPALVQELFAFSAHYTGADSSRVPADDEMDEDTLHAATISSEYLSNRASTCKCDDTRLKRWYWFCKEKVFLTCTLTLIPE